MLGRIINWLLDKGIGWIVGTSVFAMMWISTWLGRVFRRGVDYKQPILIIWPLLVVLGYLALIVYTKQYWASVVLLLCGFGYTNHTLTQRSELKEEFWDSVFRRK
jgi:hypothetical protein